VVEWFAARLTTLLFDSEAAAHTADFRASLKRQGQSFGAFDVMIAGHARSPGWLSRPAARRSSSGWAKGLRSEDWLAA
jgi:tRNA(fMet)-specific endonuclease VapC